MPLDSLVLCLSSLSPFSPKQEVQSPHSCHTHGSVATVDESVAGRSRCVVSDGCDREDDIVRPFDLGGPVVLFWARVTLCASVEMSEIEELANFDKSF